MKYLKTEEGQKAFKARSSLLSARQRTAFLLFDGSRTKTEVLAMTAGLGVVQDDIEHLLQQGFLVGSADVVVAPKTPSVGAGTRTPLERYREGKLIATRLTAGLGLRGFRLNLGVEATSGYEDLLALLPKIQAAAGMEACRPLERALNE